MAELLENYVHIRKQVRFDGISVPQALVKLKKLKHVQSAFDLVLLWVAGLSGVLSQLGDNLVSDDV